MKILMQNNEDGDIITIYNNVKEIKHETDFFGTHYLQLIMEDGNTATYTAEEWDCIKLSNH